MMIKINVIRFLLFFLLFSSCKNDKKIEIKDAAFLKKNGDTNYFRITLSHIKDSFYLITFFREKKEINKYGSFIALSVQKKDTLSIIRSSMFDVYAHREPFFIIKNNQAIRFSLKDSIYFYNDYSDAQGIYTIEDSYKNLTDLVPIIFDPVYKKYELSISNGVFLKLYTTPLSEIKDSVLVDSKMSIVKVFELTKDENCNCNFANIPDYCYIRIQKDKTKYYGWINLEEYSNDAIRYKIEKEIFWKETKRKTIIYKKTEIDQNDW